MPGRDLSKSTYGGNLHIEFMNNSEVLHLNKVYKFLLDLCLESEP